MTVAVTLQLDLLLESGLHIGTGFGLAKLLDERTTRGSRAQDGRPYIPGASLKGRLRAHAETLAPQLRPADGRQLCELLFGTERQPGALVFPDAHLVAEDQLLLDEAMPHHGGTLVSLLALEERAYVALSRERRIAREDMLMRIEVAAPGLRMTTTARGWLPVAQARSALALLGLAARATTHVGGRKARGLGAVRIAVPEITLDGEMVALATLCEGFL